MVIIYLTNHPIQGMMSRVSLALLSFFAPSFPKGVDRRLIAMIRGYFDDSGTHSQSKMVVCGGILIEDAQHDLLNENWELLIKRKGLSYFHFTKFKARKLPPYSTMSDGEREMLLEQLLFAMRVRVRFCFAGTMPVSVYENTLTDVEKARYGSAFTWATQSTWRVIRNWADRHNHHDPIPFVVEAGTKDGEQIRDVFNQTYANPELRKLFRLESLTERGKVGFSGLQAADIVANSFFEITNHLIAGGQPVSKEAMTVDRILHKPHMEVRMIPFDAEYLRQEVDTLDKMYNINAQGGVTLEETIAGV